MFQADPRRSPIRLASIQAGIWAIVEANWADPFGLACPEVSCKIEDCEPMNYTRNNATTMPEGVEEAGRRHAGHSKIFCARLITRIIEAAYLPSIPNFKIANEYGHLLSVCIKKDSFRLRAKVLHSSA